MTDSKTKCSACGVSIVQSTAKATGGLCRPCHEGPDLTAVTEAAEIGVRLTMAFFFAAFAASAGYAIGSLLGNVAALLAAIPFAVVGFVCGFFFIEVKAIFRFVYGVFFD